MRAVSIVGLGRVGTALAVALQKKGYGIQSLVDQDFEALRRAQDLLEGEMPGGFSIDELISSPVFLITVKDDAIEGVAEELRRLYPASLLVHTSGLHSSLILGDGPRLSLHPLQSFASLEEAMTNLPGSYFSLEGNRVGLEWGKKVVEALGGVAMEIRAAQKPLYHLAACIASNYLITLLYEALKAMEVAGIPWEEGLSGLGALMEGTLRNAKSCGVPQALTGPLVRGDSGTIEHHLKSLQPYGELKEFYCLMALRTLQMIREGGLPTSLDAVRAMEEMISRESNRRKDN